LTSALVGGELSASRPGRFTSGKELPVPIVYEVGWTPEPVWTGIFETKLIGILKEEHEDTNVNPTGVPEARNQSERELFVDGRFEIVR
jgi:hypothetical protein